MDEIRLQLDVGEVPLRVGGPDRRPSGRGSACSDQVAPSEGPAHGKITSDAGTFCVTAEVPEPTRDLVVEAPGPR